MGARYDHCLRWRQGCLDFVLDEFQPAAPVFVLQTVTQELQVSDDIANGSALGAVNNPRMFVASDTGRRQTLDEDTDLAEEE